MENVKQNTIKYKILFIFSFLLLTLLLFNSNVFASFNFIDTEGNTQSYPDLPEDVLSSSYYVIMEAYYADQTVVIIYSNTPFVPTKHLTDIGYENNIKIESHAGYYSLEDDIWIKKDNTNSFILSGYYYSNTDIYNNVGELVFQAPVQEITLAQVLEKEKEEQPAMVLKEVLLILPLILVVVVSFLGLRKALRMLSMLLHRA